MMGRFLNILLINPLRWFDADEQRYRGLMLLALFWRSPLNRHIIHWDKPALAVYEELNKFPFLKERLEREPRFFAAIILRYIYIFSEYRPLSIQSNLHFNFLFAFLLEIPSQTIFNLPYEKALPYVKAYEKAALSIFKDSLEYDPILDDFNLRYFFIAFFVYAHGIQNILMRKDLAATKILRREVKLGMIKFFDCLIRDMEGKGRAEKRITIEEYARYSRFQARSYTTFFVILFTKLQYPYVREYISNEKTFKKLKFFASKMGELIAFSQDYNYFPSSFRKGEFYSWVYLYCIENNYFDIGQIEQYVKSGYKKVHYNRLMAGINNDELKAYFIRRLGKMLDDVYAESDRILSSRRYLEAMLSVMNPNIRPLEREKKSSLLEGNPTDKRKYINFVYSISSIFGSLNSLEEMCQQFVDEIEKNFHFTGAVLFIKDKGGESIYPFTVSQTAIIAKVLKILPIHIQAMTIPLSDKDHVLIKSMMSRQYFIEKDYTKFSPPQARSFAPYIQKFAGINVAGAFPITYKNDVLGVLVVSTNKSSFTREDIYLMKVLSNIVGNALKNWDLAHQLEDKIQSLEESNKFKGEVLEIASHELRTPATIVRDALSLINEDEDKERAMYINYARMAATRQILLVNNILNTSMIEGKSFELVKTEFSLAGAVARIAKELEVFVVDKPVEIRTDLEEVKIIADEQKIGQVIYNLMYNAVKHTKKGSITIHVHKVDGFAKLSVEDTGNGIDKENLDKIFDKYTKATNDVNKRIFATGIGLYISRYIVQAHGGEIAVESHIKEGSTFFVTLPLG